MRVTIKATDTKLTPAISKYIDRKVARFEKFLDNDDTAALCGIEVERTSRRHRSGDVHRAEFTLHTSVSDYRSEESAETLYAALDLAAAELAMEMRRDKCRSISLAKRSGARMKELARHITNRGTKVRDLFKRRGR